MPAKALSPRQLQDAQRLGRAFAQWQAARRAVGEPRSQQAAGTMLGFGQSALSQYLRGRIPLNADALAKFARLFEVPPESISPSIVQGQRALGAKLGEPSRQAKQSGSSQGRAMPGLSPELLAQARRVASVAGRTLEMQLVYWVRLGAAVELSLTGAQSLALLSGVSSAEGSWTADDIASQVAARHAVHEAQVASGERSAESLLVVPKLLAESAPIAYPKDAFGGVQPW